MEHDQFLKEINTMLRPIKLQLSFITFLSVIAVLTRATFLDIDKVVWLRPIVWVILFVVLAYALCHAGVFALNHFFSEED